MYSRIKLGIAIVKTGAQFIMQVKSTLFVPLIVTLISAVIFAAYIVGFVFLYTTGGPAAADAWGFGTSESPTAEAEYLAFF